MFRLDVHLNVYVHIDIAVDDDRDKHFRSGVLTRTVNAHFFDLSCVCAGTRHAVNVWEHR